MKKLLMLIFISLGLLTVKVNASTVLPPHPLIQFDRFLGEHPGTGDPNFASRSTSGYFYRDEGLSEKDLKQKYKKSRKIESVKLDKNYALLIFDVIYDTPTANPAIDRAIHLIAQNKSVGFCFMDNIRIDLGEFSTEPILQQILALPVNSTFLQGMVNVPPNSTLTIHEVEQGTYVERYGILRANSNPNEIALVLDSFYPKALESTFKPYIVSRLNANLPYIERNMR